MNPDNIACNCRNNDPGSITAIDGKYEPNLFRNVEIDFRKDDVNIPNILGALRSRYDPRVILFFERVYNNKKDFNEEEIDFRSRFPGSYLHKWTWW